MVGNLWGVPAVVMPVTLGVVVKRSIGNSPEEVNIVVLLCIGVEVEVVVFFVVGEEVEGDVLVFVVVRIIGNSPFEDEVE